MSDTEKKIPYEEKIVSKLLRLKLTVATAESCTGGLLAGRIVNVAGASDVFGTGFITYSNEAKKKYLKVSGKVLKKYGAVSAKCAKQMAEGVAKAAGADVGIATTGIAGPGGGTDEKPVGLVYIACTVCGRTKVKECRFEGDRQEVRRQSVEKALKMLNKCLSKMSTAAGDEL